MSEEEQNIFARQSINTQFDISNYRVSPNLIDWKIGLDKKYTYQKLKDEAKDEYELINEISSKQDKIIAKISVTEYIIREFINLFDKCNNALDEFKQEPDVEEFITNEKLGKSLERNLNEELNRYQKKIKQIQNDWYEDWKDYGYIEDYEPELRNFSMLEETSAVKLKTKLKNIFNEIYQNSTGSPSNNPLKYWIDKYVKPKLSQYKSVNSYVNEKAFNASTFTETTVKGQLRDFVLEIPKLNNYSIKEAYYKLEEIMNYVENFTEIDKTVNYFSNKTIRDRIATIKIKPGYDIGVGLVKTYLRSIYDEFASKVNGITTFIDFMKKGNSRYFKNFDNVADLLFEIYIIRTSNEINRNNFNINSIMAMYDKYMLDRNTEVVLNVKEAVSTNNLMRAISSAAKRAFNAMMPDTLNWMLANN